MCPVAQTPSPTDPADFFQRLDSVDPAAAEVKIDLCGLDKDSALERLDAIVRYCKKSSSASLYVGFDPARAGGGETLFQPVMRYFKVEKMNGHVVQVAPRLAPAAAGVFVVFRA